MSFWNRVLDIAKRTLKKTVNSPESPDAKGSQQNENVIKLIDFQGMMYNLLNQKRYISKSDYVSSIEQYNSVVDFFHVLSKSDMIENFCDANKISCGEVSAAIDLFDNIETYLNP